MLSRGSWQELQGKRTPRSLFCFCSCSLEQGHRDWTGWTQSRMGRGLGAVSWQQLTPRLYTQAQGSQHLFPIAGETSRAVSSRPEHIGQAGQRHQVRVILPWSLSAVHMPAASPTRLGPPLWDGLLPPAPGLGMSVKCGQWALEEAWDG